MNDMAAGVVHGYAYLTGLRPLRDTLFAPGDLEARLWRFNAGAEVYLLRRTDGRWSGLAVRPRPGRLAPDAGRPVDAYESRPLADTAVARTWAALQARGVLSLRDAPGRLPPGMPGMGESYAFEVRRGPRYQAEGFASVDVFPGREATAARALFAAAQALSEPRPR
jgi:hypothetical protein